MASTINASLTAGVVTTADTSGNLNLQSGGTTKLAITSTGTAVAGTNTNDSATAGYVGEYIEGVLASGSAIALVTGTPTTLASISLTAGDWDVTGMVGCQPNPATYYNYMLGCVSPTNNTLDPLQTNWASHTCFPAGPISSASADPKITVPTKRVSVASTTTYYIIILCGFTVSSCLGFGAITARRVR